MPERLQIRGPTSSVNLRLDARRIIETVELLGDRIDERFPGSGLSKLSQDLLEVSRAAVDRVVWVTRPHLLLRLGIGFVFLLMAAVLVGLAIRVVGAGVGALGGLADAVQTIEAAINEIVFIGAGIFFLVTLEGRIKRKRALRFLRELRAMAHIVDMHQLTKDPERMAHTGEDTASSPERVMTPFELGRYLDYCSEMLSLISKIAALYIQNFDDPVVLSAVDEVETLTTGLSGKIWQKIMILERAV